MLRMEIVRVGRKSKKLPVVTPLHVWAEGNIHIKLWKYDDLLLLSKMLYHGMIHVETVNYVLIGGKVCDYMPLLTAIKMGYLPITLSYYYDPRKDYIVQLKILNDEIVKKRIVVSNVSECIVHYKLHDKYPDYITSTKIIKLLDKVRFIMGR